MKAFIRAFGFKIKRPTPILLIHIAKTAGTSLRRMLQDEYGSHMVYPGDFYLKNLPNGWYPLGSEMIRDYAEIPPHNVLVGHFTAAMGNMLPRAYRTVTFLRDPVQRSLSMLGHFSRTMNIPVTALIKDAEFMNANIADYQTRILGADGVCDPAQVGVVNDNTLTRALSQLEIIDFVGLNEQFSEACKIFDNRFDTRISKNIRREAVNRSEGNELAEFIDEIDPILERDRILYEAAKDRFNRELKKKDHNG